MMVAFNNIAVQHFGTWSAVTPHGISSVILYCRLISISTVDKYSIFFQNKGTPI